MLPGERALITAASTTVFHPRCFQLASLSRPRGMLVARRRKPSFKSHSTVRRCAQCYGRA